MTDHVWDIETYPNCFLLCIADYDKRKIKVFEISNRRDDRDLMLDHLRSIYKSKGRMVGFNSLGFDYPVLHYIIKNQDVSVKKIYQFANKVIQAGYTDQKWRYLVKENEMVIPQIDLFKINHFDNKNKATSLKMIEFNSRAENIEDLPFPVGKVLTSSEIDQLIKYNIHDVKETVKFYEENLEQIAFREKLQLDYGLNAMNWNDPKIGAEYFVMELEKAGVPCYNEVANNNGGVSRKPIQTERSTIDLSTCIFPYVEFERPEFRAVLAWMKVQTISETKGVFSNIRECDLGDVARYANMKVVRQKLKNEPTAIDIECYKKDNSLCWIEELELKAKLPEKLGGGFKKSYYLCHRVAESLNVVVDGLEYVFGTGGIHASLEKQVILADNDFIIEDEDVSSYYPNLAIKNKIYPEHLGEKFCDIYEYLYNLRKTFGKKTAENAMLKLALNGTYGKSNDKFSPFYDPKFTMMITINGQLSLCMIVERLLKLDGLKIIQVNTDGLTFKRKRSQDEQVASIISWWQNITKLELERVDYSKMVIRDVNSYVAVYDKHSHTYKEALGELKAKGAYEYVNLPHNKNHSALVVKKAAEAYLVHNTDPEEFIRNHKDVYDFQLRTKVPRSSKLIGIRADGSEQECQNITRYYISEDGVSLVKIMPPLKEFMEVTILVDNQTMDKVAVEKEVDIARFTKKGYEIVGKKTVKSPDRRFEIEAGKLCTVTNNIKDFKWNVDYNYYIERTWKLINFADSDDGVDDGTVEESIIEN